MGEVDYCEGGAESSMTVLEILSIGAVGIIMFPIISITFSCCTEIWFNRKEKHMCWCADKIVERGKKKNEQNYQNL